MKIILLRTVVAAGLLLSLPAACTGETAMVLQLGVMHPYEYPVLSEDVVASKTSSPLVSVRAGGGISARWQIVVAAQYWSGKGGDDLIRISEDPPVHVDTWLLPVSAGIRYQVGPLDRAGRHYLGLAPTLAILHTAVAPRFSPEDTGSLGSATYVAPALAADASLDIPFSSRVGLQFSVVYLLSARFRNSEALVVHGDFGGLNQIALLGGVRIAPF